jgi:hypothetical protein
MKMQLQLADSAWRDRLIANLVEEGWTGEPQPIAVVNGPVRIYQ